MLKSEDLLAAAGPAFDGFSYHYYGAASERCAKAMPAAATREQDALSEDWLSRTGRVESFYAGLRDRFEPGKPLWITETADAACGGNPWASTYLDSFRYLNQLGLMAKRGVQVVMHNTFASSDYGLLDQNSLEPRPNYWAALLWRKLMGTVVLDAGPSPSAALHLYAHCLRDGGGGVAVLAINADTAAAFFLAVPTGAKRYTLTARTVTATQAQLNGAVLALTVNDTLPSLIGVPASDRVNVEPLSLTFLAFADAHNVACR
jgi:hypothetical protein